VAFRSIVWTEPLPALGIEAVAMTAPPASNAVAVPAALESLSTKMNEAMVTSWSKRYIWVPPA
jgi:hypothetical protein